MANSLYAFGRQAILDGSVVVASATIKAALLHGASYTPNLTTHEFLSDIPGGATVATSSALTSKTTAAGAFGADNSVLSSVSGSQVDYILIYADTGTPSTSRLLALIDTATGIPFTPGGGSVTIAWDTGVNKIFRI